MTECPPDCGACCNPVLLSFHPDDMVSASAEFCQQHWHVIDEHPAHPHAQYAVRCDVFDPHTHTCTAYDDRPPICRYYPWYGQEPDPDRFLDPICAYQADVRTVLPIVAVTHGR